MVKGNKKKSREIFGGDTYIPSFKEQEKIEDQTITRNMLGFMDKGDWLNKIDNFGILQKSIDTKISKNLNKNFYSGLNSKNNTNIPSGGFSKNKKTKRSRKTKKSRKTNRSRKTKKSKY